ncbi:hypothetical protein TEA_011416 [Camellia sinensis var. sinensis]|uniref:SAM-dependent MTase RsmB/NOP-type domain-containing protein n=1 Tax=Camellia sinensis var. sinensis TaxID=542762 RepID=A0A4S4EJG5_CAMSN|nr:hypothetical protein TEA_011416 [Camellia sinensis var. sinensis]
MDPSDRYRFEPNLRWNPQVEEYFIKAYGADHFARISKSLTCAQTFSHRISYFVLRPSCYSCIRVNTLKSTSDAVIEKLSEILQETGQQSAIDDMNQSDANAGYIMGQEHKFFVKESNTSPCDSNQAALAVSESTQTGLVSKCQLPGLDYVLFVKGSGPHNISYPHAQDKPPKEIIVSRKCAEAVLRGAQVYVPGVLACSAHVEKGDAVAVSVAVEQPGQDGGWGVDPYFSERSGLYIGQGTTMMSRAGMFRVLQGIAVDMNNRVFELPSFHDVLEGEIFLQNLPSIITAHALDPQQGDRILDMCAAPGGKTTAIAILMKDKGEVVAVDRSHNKRVAFLAIGVIFSPETFGSSSSKLPTYSAAYYYTMATALSRFSHFVTLLLLLLLVASLFEPTHGGIDISALVVVSLVAVSLVVDISALVMFRPFWRKVLVTSAKSPLLSAVHSSNLTPSDALLSITACKHRITRCFSASELIGVLDIQKLAAEMGLNCITTYKLDALKAVHKRNESSDMHTSSFVAPEPPNIDFTRNENFTNGQATQMTYTSKAELRKSISTQRNGVGRNHGIGGRVEKSEGFSPNSFDRVLLDAPCSALGLRPRLFAGEDTIESLKNDAKYQRKMFDQAVQLVRPGGVLVYSTCTINPGENEALVRYALDAYKFLSLAVQHPKIGGPGLVGGCELSNGYIEEWLRPGEEDLVQRFDPSSPLDTIGFFIAKFNVGPKGT